jgi:uncharacterized repeat protein (TIGR03803 family)
MREISWWKTACAVCVLCAATAIALRAQTYTLLADFNGTNGGDPGYVTLVQGPDGNLWGTTIGGGPEAVGTVFKMTPTGTLTTVYNFCMLANCDDGSYPYGGLVLGSDGNFYGTTEQGGGQYELGIVFKLTPEGELTTLHYFCENGCSDGYNPKAALVQGTDGNFYGTSTQGGLGYGAVFKITPGGTLTPLHSFEGGDGRYPVAGLIQAADGDFYGTTVQGGDGSCFDGCGTVFKITPGGTLTMLHSFNSSDGASPYAPLVQGTDGNFYGTTETGGAFCNGGCGTVFKMTPAGTVTTLHSFRGFPNDGGFPMGGLLLGPNGIFYGTTTQGGLDPSQADCLGYGVGCGVIFEISPGGSMKIEHFFAGFPIGGSEPNGGLALATNGTFYGVTSGGGPYCNTFGCGTAFSVSSNFAPFVETVPPSSGLGAAVNILGTNLTTATSVTFNGTPATFNVVSSSLITTTVPAGATSGKVQVVTPVGTLTSNVPFRVLP